MSMNVDTSTISEEQMHNIANFQKMIANNPQYHDYLRKMFGGTLSEKGQELLVTNGNLAGHCGWVNLSKGKNGFSSTGKSVHVIVRHEDGAISEHYIRSTSVKYLNWESKPTVFTQVLSQNMKVSKALGALSKALDDVLFDDEAEAEEFLGELILHLQEKLRTKK